MVFCKIGQGCPVLGEVDTYLIGSLCFSASKPGVKDLTGDEDLTEIVQVYLEILKSRRLRGPLDS